VEESCAVRQALFKVGSSPDRVGRMRSVLGLYLDDSLGLVLRRGTLETLLMPL